MAQSLTTAPGQASHDSAVPARARWLARLALLTATVAVLLPPVAAGVLSSLAFVLLAVLCAAAAALGAWEFLTHRGAARLASGAVVVVAPLVLLAGSARRDLLWVALGDVALWWAALAAAHAAAAALKSPARPMDEPVAAPPRSPFLVMNPRSGGGKVGSFDLVSGPARWAPRWRSSTPRGPTWSRWPPTPWRAVRTC